MASLTTSDVDVDEFLTDVYPGIGGIVSTTTQWSMSPLGPQNPAEAAAAAGGSGQSGGGGGGHLGRGQTEG